MKMKSINTLSRQLKKHILNMSDSAIIECAMGRHVIAIFPEARGEDIFQDDPYFASDCRNNACEQYWQGFGEREVLFVFDHDPDLYELQLGWDDELLGMIEGEPGLHPPGVKKVIAAGLSALAKQIRESAARGNHADEIREKWVYALEKKLGENT
jgi:hypothetical protein